MPLKSIVVFLELRSQSDARLRYAAALAATHGARLTGVFATPAVWSCVPAATYVRGPDAMRGMIEGQRAADVAATQEMRERLESLAAETSVAVDILVVREVGGEEQLRRSLLHADLVVVGQGGRGGLPDTWSTAGLLFATGLPFLAVPDAWQSGTVAERVLIGWNASREARRAIADALPLLTAARFVAAVVVDPDRIAGPERHPAADVFHYLAIHGITAIVEEAATGKADVADVILDVAARHHADLIVLGAYSHPRPQEVVFGGVTRSIIRKAALPLMVSH